METALIIALAALVILLAVLLVLRIRRESRQNAVLSRLSLTEFADLIKSSIQDNSIQEVAGGVSDMLKHACGCERIIFLRKRRALLELNYFYGIQRFNRRELRVRYTENLVVHLKGHLLPEPLSRIEALLPQPLVNRLREWRFDMYFPIFWRDHLYGLYFIKGTKEMQSNAFKLVIASLAQTLSAAYHVRWQEDRLDRLTGRLDSLQTVPSRPREEGPPSHGVIKLIRHHDSETIVARIMDEVHKDLHLQRFAFLYQSRRGEEPLLILKRGVGKDVAVPERQVFSDLTAKLGANGHLSVAELVAADGPQAALGQELRQAGLKYVTTLTLSPGRVGLLAWDDKEAPEKVLTALENHRFCISELIENAESFEQIEELSYTDPLTGLSNQRYFLKRLGEEIGRADRYKRRLALIIFDLDDLKSINDSYGHQAGDAVLKQMGEVLQTSIRGIDVIARYGGDEFCIVMPESDQNNCVQFMRRLQRKIVAQRFRIDQYNLKLECTISLGGAVYPDHGSSIDQLIYSADMALLRAKESGRNQFVIF